jgi:hypothetical protein
MYDAVSALARAHHPLLAEIRVESVSGSLGSRIRDRDGMDVDLPPGKAGFEMTMRLDAVRDANFDDLIVEIDEASDLLAKDLIDMFLSTMSRVTEATGNVVDAGGQKFSFDLFYEMLSKIDFGVDENDELVLPSLVMHPEQLKQIQGMGPPTPEQERRLAELKERKREEALARRRRRRLS